MCHEYGSHPPIAPITGGATDGDDIVLTAEDGNKFSAYFAEPVQPKGLQVIIFPDVRGLHPFYKELALRLAENGSRALAIDYFGRTAGTSPRDDKFDYAPHVAEMKMPAFLKDVQAAIDYLQKQTPRTLAIVVVGFCRGGTLALFTGTEKLDLSGIIAFYSGFSRPIPGSRGSVLDQAEQIRYPVLGLYGGADPSISQTDIQKLDEQLDKAGVRHEIVVYPEAPHSFFDRRYTEFADASADAWQRVQDFIASLADNRSVK